MRINLALQRIKTRLQQQPGLLFQLEFDTCSVPYLERDADAHHGRRADSGKDPWLRAGDYEYLVGKKCVQLHARKLQNEDDDEERDLPVHARTRDIAFDPTKDGQVNEW